jgi:superfamily II DNA or RNA helicase
MNGRVCTVKLRNETAAILNGVEKHHLERIVDEMAEYVPGYKYMPLYTMGVWDGKTKFCTATGKTYQAMLPDIIPMLKDFGYKLRLVDERDPVEIDPTPVDEDLFADYGWKLRAHQVRAINAIIDNAHRGIIVAATGAGKAQPLYAKVLTPSGWREMGSLRVGEVICTPSGRQTIITGIFPQGQKEIFEITFDDGSKTRACAEHLWETNFPIKDHTAKTHRKIVDTKEIQRFLSRKSSGAHMPGNVSIPVASPTEFEELTLPVSPYLLGALLGDGSLSGNMLMFSNADPYVIERIKQEADKFDTELVFENNSNCDYRIRVNKQKEGLLSRLPNGKNGLLEAVKEVGIWGTKSDTKFIPEPYLSGSINQRLELLRGLMDTDGTVDVRGNVSFTTVSETLAKQVQYLVWSIGGVCTITTRTPTYPYKGEKRSGRLAYTCFIRMTREEDIFFTPVKKERCRKIPRRFPLSRQVKSIVSIGTEEAQCIMVADKEHLYITDDFIVTHNTLICAGLSKTYGDIGFRSLVIVPSRDLIRQTLELYQKLGLDTGQYSGKEKDLDHQHVISTWQALKNRPDIMQTFQMFICDEVHMAKGPVLTKLLIEHGSHIPVRVGCTGTVPKDAADYKTVYAAIGERGVVEITAAELQDQKLLATLHITQIQLKDTNSASGENLPEFAMEKAAIDAIPERKPWIANFIRSIGDSSGNTLVLVSSIRQGKALRKLIGEDRSVFLYGADADAVRKEAYDSFAHDDNIIVIANIQIAGTGLSIDRIFNLVLIDVGKAFTRVVQAVGRGLRMGADKEHVEVYDIGSNMIFSARHMQKRQKYYRDAKYPFTFEKVKYR